MNERDFFNEKEETKKATFSCPHCRERAEYDVRWLKRTRRRLMPTSCVVRLPDLRQCG